LTDDLTSGQAADAPALSAGAKRTAEVATDLRGDTLRETAFGGDHDRLYARAVLTAQEQLADIIAGVLDVRDLKRGQIDGLAELLTQLDR
jgi:hypothetical protein